MYHLLYFYCELVPKRNGRTTNIFFDLDTTKIKNNWYTTLSQKVYETPIPCKTVRVQFLHMVILNVLISSRKPPQLTHDQWMMYSFEKNISDQKSCHLL